MRQRPPLGNDRGREVGIASLVTAGGLVLFDSSAFPVAELQGETLQVRRRLARCGHHVLRRLRGEDEERGDGGRSISKGMEQPWVLGVMECLVYM